MSTSRVTDGRPDSMSPVSERSSPYVFTGFERLVAETANWCTMRSRPEAPATSLRSPGLAPGPCFENRRPRPWSGETLEFSYLEDFETVALLAERRRGPLNGPREPSTTRSADDGDGRVLLFWPGDTLFTQATHPASDGFFELNGDLPPWDTWVTYLLAPRSLLREHWNRPAPHRLEVLVCWIPTRFVELADRGFANSEIPLGEWAPIDRPLRALHRDLLRSLGHPEEPAES